MSKNKKNLGKIYVAEEIKVRKDWGKVRPFTRTETDQRKENDKNACRVRIQNEL